MPKFKGCSGFFEFDNDTGLPHQEVIHLGYPRHDYTWSATVDAISDPDLALGEVYSLEIMKRGNPEPLNRNVGCVIGIETHFANGTIKYTFCKPEQRAEWSQRPDIKPPLARLFLSNYEQ